MDENIFTLLVYYAHFFGGLSRPMNITMINVNIFSIFVVVFKESVCCPTNLTLKAAREKMHLKMSSAANYCLALLMN